MRGRESLPPAIDDLLSLSLSLARSTDDMEDSPIFPSAWQIPVDYKIKGRFRLSAGSDLTIYDAYGAVAFRVHGRSLPRHVRIVFDAAETPLFTIAHHEDGWQGFRGNSWECKDLIFVVHKIVYSAFKTELEVFLSGGGLGDPQSSFRLKGSPFQRSCTIYKGGSIVAQTSPLYTLKKVIYSRRKFRFTIFPGNDHALIIAMLVIFLGGS